MLEDLLLVDDDVGAIRLMDRVLEGVGRHRFATSGFEALRLARSVRPDMVLLDADMPGLDGLGVLRAMRADPQLQDVPVIMVTSHEELEGLSLEGGAEDFIAKPLERARLLARVNLRLREYRQRHALQRLALLDALTELANARHFTDTLEREWARTVEAGGLISLVLLTVDGLADLHLPPRAKSLQRCIRSTAWVLQDIARRPADFIAHLGPVAFALLLPDTDCPGAQDLLVHIQSALQRLVIDMGDGEAPRALSAAVGIACARLAGPSRPTPCAGHFAPGSRKAPPGAAQLLHAAQGALQDAQAAGPGQTRVIDLQALDHGIVTAPAESARQTGLPTRFR